MFDTKPQQQAAADQTAGLNAGFTQASGAINTGQTNTNADYATALTPVNTNLTTDQNGQNTYADATGANGATGYARAVQNFQTNPGYQFQLDQGTQNVLRNANATGATASGGTMAALQTLGQGQANQSWQQYLAGLQPFVGASTANAGVGATTGIAKAGTDASAASTLANLGWAQQTGIGNANANASLAQTGVNSNILNAGLSGINFASQLAGFL